MEHCCTNIIAACFTLPPPPPLLHHHLHLQPTNCLSETEIKCTWGIYLFLGLALPDISYIWDWWCQIFHSRHLRWAVAIIFEIGGAKWNILYLILACNWQCHYLIFEVFDASRYLFWVVRCQIDRRRQSRHWWRATMPLSQREPG